jgi:glucose-6-phosphate 1-dehydrogenase
MSEFVAAPPFDIVIFGGSGDLAQRKLLPALYHRDQDGQLSNDSRIFAASRSDMSTGEFRELVLSALKKYLHDGGFNEEVWERFSRRLVYVAVDAVSESGWESLAEAIADSGERTRIFYCATAPRFFGPIATRLGQAGLVEGDSRIVLEKPVGHDRASAEAINNEVCAVFNEPQVFRIDHYLGKETVQNLLALRFGNAFFEHLWNHSTIDHVQITVAEDIGVGKRGDYYDKIGTMRDMVQNHLLQLLCLVAMEPPADLNPETIRDEKLKVLRALKPIGSENVKRNTSRGQYSAGAIDGEPVMAYLDELENAAASNTETFVAIKAEVENWRWANTPFYMRTGKRMAMKSSEIVIEFTPVSHSIFPEESAALTPNRLTIRLQPNEGVKLSLMSKEPGPGGFSLRSLPLNLSFSDAFELRYPDAYERLLMEVIRGNPALFMRRDEVETAWAWVDRIISAWQEQGIGVQKYVPGTWGPAGSALMLDRDDRGWHDTVDE